MEKTVIINSGSGRKNQYSEKMEVEHVWFGVLPHPWNGEDHINQYRGVVQYHNMPCKVESRDGKEYILAGNAARDYVELCKSNSQQVI